MTALLISPDRDLAQLLTGSAWSLASVAVALSAGLLRTIVIARFLGPADIGLMGIALLPLGFVEAIASTGVDTALIAQRKHVETYLDPAFTIQVTRGLAVFALLWITAPALAWAFHNDAAVSVIRSGRVDRPPRRRARGAAGECRRGPDRSPILGARRLPLERPTC